MKNKNAVLFAIVAAALFVAGCSGENMAPNYNRCNHMQCGPVDAGPDAGCVDDWAEGDGGVVNG